jgi:tetratricopeptide (TPR) repeat protein
MKVTCYSLYLYSQAFCRFDHAVSSKDKARVKDPGNTEVVTMLNKVKAVARARSLGNELFNSGIFSEACLAYGEGIKQHHTNKVLYANRAACWFKLGQWEKSVEDCNKALKIHPNYTKVLLRRAASYGKVAYFFSSI